MRNSSDGVFHGLHDGRWTHRPCMTTEQHEQRERHRTKQVETLRPLRIPHYSTLISAISIYLAFFCSLTFATRTGFQNLGSDLQVSSNVVAAIPQAARIGAILVDQDPEPHQRVPESHLHLARRDTSSSSSTSSSASATSVLVATATTAASAPLPTVWDTGIGTNFTVAACPSYINSFLQSSPFKACLPFSLLIESSVSFFRAEQSLVRTTQALDASCGANSTVCSKLLTQISTNLTSICSADYALQNPVIIQMRDGLLAYSSLYAASCLKSSATSNYCFADAITNASSPTDSYIYFLPLGQGLVGGTKPTCNECLQNTMQIFNSQSADRTQEIATTYVDAAKLINGFCGPDFVTATLPTAKTSSGARWVFGNGGSVWAAVLGVAIVLVL